MNSLSDTAVNLAQVLGCELIAAKLIITLLIGYPIALLYSVYVYKFSATIQHWYLLICGVVMFYWNFDIEVVHFIIAIGSTLAILHAMPGTRESVVAVGLFNMAYLFYGYYSYLDCPGKTTWTTPFCCLVLRLIGLAWDMHDGKTPIEQRSEYQKRAALTKKPGFLETYAFCFTPTAFIAGPQFPLRHYQSFIAQTLRPKKIFEDETYWSLLIHNKKIQRVVTRLCMAAVYLVFYVHFSPIFTLEYISSPEFLTECNLLYRLSYMAVYAKICVTKYFIIWLIGEGGSVVLGLGCTGRMVVKNLVGKKNNDSPSKRTNAVLSDANAGLLPSELNLESLMADKKAGRIKVREAEHTAAANVSVVRFEMATNTDGLVSGHNINTNKWMLEYVYKRCRFLGNKYLSQLITLMFLAVWHGFYSGYYVNFFMEFITVVVEKDFLTIVKLSKYRNFVYGTWPGWIVSGILGKVHLFYVIGCPLVCFNLLHFKDYYPIIRSVYFLPFIYLLWPLARPAVKSIFPKEPVVEQKPPVPEEAKSVSEESKSSLIASTSSGVIAVAADNMNNETALDLATRLRRQSKSAVDEAALDQDDEETEYSHESKIVSIVPEVAEESGDELASTTTTSTSSATLDAASIKKNE